MRSFDTYSVFPITWSPDSKLIACSNDYDIIILNAITFDIEKKIQFHKSYIFALVWNQKINYLFSGGENMIAVIWNTETWKEKCKFDVSDEIFSASWSSCGNLIAIGLKNGEIIIFDIESNSKKNLIEHENAVNSVSWSPDNKKLISGSRDCMINLWNTETMELLNKIDGKSTRIQLVSFNPDGKIAISGSHDGTIHLWDLYFAKEINSYKIHTGAINSICFDNNGKYVVSSSKDKKINLIPIIDYWSFTSLFHAVRTFKRVSLENIFIYFPRNCFENIVLNYPTNIVYPFGITLFHIFSEDYENMYKLITLCQEYQMYPPSCYAADWLGRSPVHDEFYKSGNKTTKKLLLDFYLSIPDEQVEKPYSMEDAINLKMLNSLFQEGSSNYVIDFLEKRFIEPDHEIDNFPWKGETDYKVFSHFNGICTLDNFIKIEKDNFWQKLKIFTLDTIKLSLKIINPIPEKKIELIKPEIKMLDIKNILKIPTQKESSFLLNASKLPSHHPLFDNTIYEAIVQFKWQTYGLKDFMQNSMRYIFLMFLITANSVYIMPDRISISFSSKLDRLERASIILNSIILATLVIFLILEAIQIKCLGWKNYYRSIWNKFDICIIGLGISLGIIDIFDSLDKWSDREALKILHSIQVFLVWARILNIFRGYQGTSFMVRILMQVAYDIRNFILMLLLFLISLCFALYIIQVSYAKNKWFSFQAFYDIALGDFEKYGKYETHVPTYFWIIFLVTTIIVYIVMMNLLIAIISDSYDKVVGMERLANNYEKTQLIVEIEKTMSLKDINTMNNKINEYLFVVFRSSQDEQNNEVQFNDRMRSKIEKIEAKLQKVDTDKIENIENEVKVTNKEMENIKNIEEQVLKIENQMVKFESMEKELAGFKFYDEEIRKIQEVNQKIDNNEKKLENIRIKVNGMEEQFEKIISLMEQNI